jgi:hypothetical protein
MADVKTHLYEWSTSEGSNLPIGSTVVGTNLDDNLRMIQKVVRDMAAPTTLAAAGTTDLGSKDETFITLTGTAATITGLGTVSAGIYKWVICNAAHVWTHNGTSLILPTGANITAASGDVGCFVSLGSGNWRCLSYMKADGNPLANITQLSDGSVSAPALTFVSDTNTGLYRIGADNLAVTAGGVKVVDVKSDVVSVAAAKTSGNSSVTVSATSDSGSGTATVDISATGTTVGAGAVNLTAKTTSTIDAPTISLKSSATNRVVTNSTGVRLTGHLRAGSGGTLSSSDPTGAAVTGSSSAGNVTFNGSSGAGPISIGWGTTYASVPVFIHSIAGTGTARVTVATVSTTGVDLTFSAAPASGSVLSFMCVEV